jgi:hypothetical protein
MQKMMKKMGGMGLGRSGKNKKGQGKKGRALPTMGGMPGGFPNFN